MSKLPDLGRTLGAEALDPELARKLAPLLDHLQRNFNAIRDALANGLTLIDNLNCEVVSARFTHGVAQRVRLQKLKQATAAVVLSADGAIPWGAPMLVNVAPQRVNLTIWFNDPTATSKTVNLLLLNVGTGLQTQPSYATPLIDPGGEVDGYVLTADSAQPRGTKWAALSASPGDNPLDATSSPDSRDEEFNGSAFGLWSTQGTWVSGGFDHYNDFTTLNNIRYSWNGVRPGWLMVQPSRNASNAPFTLYKSVTFATNTQAFMRLAHMNLDNSATDGGIIFLAFYGQSGGAPDNNNRVIVSIRTNGTYNSEIRIEKVVGGAYVNIQGFTLGSNSIAHRPDYLLLQRNGASSFNAWWSQASGGWQCFNATFSAAITPVYVLLGFQHVWSGGNAGPAGPPILGCDFIRVRDTLLLPATGIAQ